MQHVFIYAVPTTQEKDARLLEVSAVRVNGFGPYRREKVEATYTGIDLTELYKKIPVPSCVIVSYNNEITRALLRIENEKLGLIDVFVGRAWVDLNHLAWPLLVTKQIKARSLEVLAKHFGVILDTHSDSADICTAMLQIYGFMMRRYNTALAGESFVREMGGESLNELRKIIGF